MRRSVACGDPEDGGNGCEHQTTCMNVVKELIKTDRVFLFELPWNAVVGRCLRSWKLHAWTVCRLLKENMCAYWMPTVSTSGCAKLVTKPMAG